MAAQAPAIAVDSAMTPGEELALDATMELAAGCIKSAKAARRSRSLFVK